MFRGKNYTESAKLIDRAVLYDPAEAFALVCQTSKAKFDETVEMPDSPDFAGKCEGQICVLYGA